MTIIKNIGSQHLKILMGVLSVTFPEVAGEYSVLVMCTIPFTRDWGGLSLVKNDFEDEVFDEPDETKRKGDAEDGPGHMLNRYSFPLFVGEELMAVSCAL